VSRPRHIGTHRRSCAPPPPPHHHHKRDKWHKHGAMVNVTVTKVAKVTDITRETKAMLHVITALQVAISARTSSFVILLLPMVRNWKVQFWDSPRGHVLLTKFNPNPSSGPRVEPCVQTDMTGLVCFHFVQRTLKILRSAMVSSAST
jgi:hypothetical protein